MRHQQDDGGRKTAGYKGETGDCAARAISIAVELGYQDAYDLVNSYGQSERSSKSRRAKSSARTGVYTATMRKIMEELDWLWVSTMKIGQGCKIHMRTNELPSGRIIVRLSKHYAAVIDGVVHDTHDPTRGGSRCVYGYWRERTEVER